MSAPATNIFVAGEWEGEQEDGERKAEVILGCLLFCRSALHATCIHYSTTPTSPWRPSFDKSQSERGRIASCFDPYPICTRNRLGSAGKSSSTVVIHMYTNRFHMRIRRLTILSRHTRVAQVQGLCSCTSCRPPLWAPLINLCPQMNARQCGVVSTPAGSWASKLPLSPSSSLFLPQPRV